MHCRAPMTTSVRTYTQKVLRAPSGDTKLPAALRVYQPHNKPPCVAVTYVQLLLCIEQAEVVHFVFPRPLQGIEVVETCKKETPAFER